MIGEEGAILPKSATKGTLKVLTKAEVNNAIKTQADNSILVEHSSFEAFTKELDPNTPMSKIIDLFKDAKAKKLSKK